MVAEVVHGAPCRFADPARFSFSHGGKDRHPFPVPLRVYDETIRVLKSAVQQAKLERRKSLAHSRAPSPGASRMDALRDLWSGAGLDAIETGKSPCYGRSPISTS